jgi:hypothetical protein
MSIIVSALLCLMIAVPIICVTNFLIALHLHRRICRDRGWRTNWKGDITGNLDDTEVNHDA